MKLDEVVYHERSGGSLYGDALHRGAVDVQQFLARQEETRLRNRLRFEEREAELLEARAEAAPLQPQINATSYALADKYYSQYEFSAPDTAAPQTDVDVFQRLSSSPHRKGAAPRAHAAPPLARTSGIIILQVVRADVAVLRIQSAWRRSVARRALVALRRLRLLVLLGRVRLGRCK